MIRFLFSLVLVSCVLAIHYPGSVLPPAGENFADLPWSYKEVQTIASVVDMDAYTGAEATEDRFKSLAPHYRILHLATHGILDETNPMNSRLVFNRAYGSSEDGLLHAYEVYGMDLDADLVVLGSCRSGSGKFITGEGVVGLTHSFLHAGCGSVLMSLWPIDDKATAGLMIGLYRHMQSRIPVDEALRKAKLDMIHGTDPVLANPFYWAGVTKTGRR